MILSAYYVSTSTPSFGVCEWPATSKAAAEKLAETLSVKHSGDARYPSAFWVCDSRKSMGKWWRGNRYEAHQTV